MWVGWSCDEVLDVASDLILSFLPEFETNLVMPARPGHSLISSCSSSPFRRRPCR